MGQQKKKSEINLIPQDKFATSDLGRILGWLLSVSRKLTILIELLLMAAFLSRFWLDTNISKLNDEIKQKQAYILSLSSFENEFNQTKDKIKILSVLTSPENMLLGRINKVASFVPNNIVLNNVQVTQDRIQIDGISPSEFQILQFITNLEATKEFTNSTLSTLSLDEETQQLFFSIIIQVTK